MASSIPVISLVCMFIGISSLSTSHCGPSFNKNTLRPGQALNSSSFLVSASGEFTLGFNSGYLILRSKEYIYWVANPGSPISHPSRALLTLNETVLQITLDGEDIVRPKNNTEYPIVLYSCPHKNSTHLVASLSDSGILVLQDNSTSSSQQSMTTVLLTLWQSSDHPTAVLMPWWKLGNDRTGGSLYSWVTSQNSTRPGAFILSWNIFDHRLSISKGGDLWWTSGDFVYGSFQFLSAPSYSLSVVSNQYEDYFTYDYTAVGDQNVTSVWVLTTDGELYDVKNNVSIVRAADCDGYGTDIGGCQRWASGNCPRDDDFETKLYGFSFKPINTSTSINSTWVDTSHTTQSRSGIEHCKAICWMDCDCLGFDFPFENQAGCRFWSAEYYQFLEDPDSSSTKYVIPGLVRKKLSLGHNDVHASHNWIVHVPGNVALLLGLVLCSMWYLIHKRNLAVRENQTKIQDILNTMNSNRPANANGLQSGGGKEGQNLSVFKYKCIMAATRNFSDEFKLGEGGFGPVYKGTLVNGQEVAVKRLSKHSGQGISEFRNELILIYELQHTNLVQLFGFCIHGEERMLIYEYMPNKSLDYFLFDSTRCRLLDWNKRFHIIEGIAQGLLYLHKYSRLRIIHRDLKASNVLLDENMNPKISDFGMARIFAHDEQEVNTMKIVGTRGYMPPEYVMGGNLSIKSDVYSFGVLTLEILSGRKNNSFYNDDRAINLVDYAWVLWKEGAGLGLMDPTLSDSCDRDQLLRCIHVGLLCVEENAASRPTILDVISMLTNASISLPIPTKPAFCKQRNMTTADVRVSIPEMVASANGISNSDFDGR